MNNPHVAKFLYDISESVLGTENVRYLDPIMGSEDFSFMTQQAWIYIILGILALLVILMAGGSILSKVF